jgi:hypothetical protein
MEHTRPASGDAGSRKVAQGKTAERYEHQEGGGVKPAAFVPTGTKGTYAESCSDNSSIMRTVESSLTTPVKRFLGRSCDLARTRAPRPVREGNQRLRHSKCLSPFLTEITMAQRKPVTRQQSKPRKNVSSKALEQPGLFAVITSNLLNMIWLTTAFAAVLALFFAVAKWA